MEVQYGFTLQQTVPNKHGMILRSQSTQQHTPPTLIPPDSNSASVHPRTPQFHSIPNLIPPDNDHNTSGPLNYRSLAVNQIVAEHLFNSHAIHHVFNEITGERETMDTLLNGIQGINWTQSLSNEWDGLGDGRLGKVKGTNTI